MKIINDLGNIVQDGPWCHKNATYMKARMTKVVVGFLMQNLGT